MADQTQNGPPNTVGIGGDKDTPLGSSIGLDDVLRGVNTGTAATLALAEKLKVILEDFPEIIKGIASELKKVHTSVKDNVGVIEDTVDSYENLKKQAKEFDKVIKDTNRSEDQKNRSLRDMVTSYEKILKSGTLNVQKTREVTEHYKQLKKALQDVKDRTLDWSNPSHLKPFQVGLDNMLRTIKSIGVQYKEINSTGLHARQDNMRAAFSQAGFYMKPGYRDRAVRMGQLAANLKENTTHHEALSKKAFEEKLSQTPGLKRINLWSKYRKANGEVDWDTFSKASGKFDAKAATKQMGGGGLEFYALGRLANAKAGKGTLGFGTKAILGMMEKGEGSAVKGMASWGMGLAEKGVGMGAGALAIPGVGEVVALLSLVKAGFDKQTQTNAGIEKNLGTAGVFAPGRGNIFQNMGNVQANLMPSFGGGFYNTLGISYKKNMEIAQAMQASGVGLSELQQPESVLKNKQWGPGGYGAIQHTAYTTARLAGFDTAAGTAQAIKLVQTYAQSLTSTHDFFITLNKDAKAAGITTTAYVGIIDEVTSGLDRMNKSFGEVVNTIRILGRTGTATADDIKAYMNAITGGKKDLATTAFLAGQMIQNNNLAENRLEEGGLEQTVAARARELANTLADSGIKEYRNKDNTAWSEEQKAEFATKLQGMDVGQIQKIISKVPVGQTGLTTTGIDKADTGLRLAMTLLQGRKEFDAGKINNLQYGQILQNNQGFQSKAETNQSALDTARRMSNISLADFMNTTKWDKSYKGAAISEVLGTSPLTTTNDLRNVYSHTAGALVDRFQNIDLTKPEQNKDLTNIAKVLGVKGTGNEQLQNLKNMSGDRDAMIDKLYENGKVLEAYVRNAPDQNVKENERKEAEGAAAQLNIATADIFADAFEHLFMLIVSPVNKILDGLTHLPFFKPTELTAGQKKNWDEVQGRVINAARANLDAQISEAKGKGDKVSLDLAKSLQIERDKLDNTDTADQKVAAVATAVKYGTIPDKEAEKRGTKDIPNSGIQSQSEKDNLGLWKRMKMDLNEDTRISGTEWKTHIKDVLFSSPQDIVDRGDPKAFEKVVEEMAKTWAKMSPDMLQQQLKRSSQQADPNASYDEKTGNLTFNADDLKDPAGRDAQFVQALQAAGVISTDWKPGWDDDGTGTGHGKSTITYNHHVTNVTSNNPHVTTLQVAPVSTSHPKNELVIPRADKWGAHLLPQSIDSSKPWYKGKE